MTLKKWRESHPEYLKEWHEAHPEWMDSWRESRPNYERDRSRRLRKSEERECECIICGQKFKTYIKHKATCCDECEEKHKLKRIPQEQIIDTDITLEKLFKRDSGVCYLCGKPCDWSDRDVKRRIIGIKYPSMDHVIPVSKGGEHSWQNVRLAHFGCNSAKSNKLLTNEVS